MNRKEIKLPDVCQIIISGPTQCGKSIASAAIRDALKERFGAEVVIIDKDAQGIEQNAEAEGWERRMAGSTVWVVSEANESRPPDTKEASKK